MSIFFFFIIKYLLNETKRSIFVLFVDQKWSFFFAYKRKKTKRCKALKFRTNTKHWNKNKTHTENNTLVWSYSKRGKKARNTMRSRFNSNNHSRTIVRAKRFLFYPVLCFFSTFFSFWCFWKIFKITAHSFDRTICLPKMTIGI